MNLTDYMPSSNYSFSTRLSTEEIMKLIEDNIENEKRDRLSFFMNKKLKSYYGKTKGNKFVLKHNILRNTMFPLIHGEVYTNNMNSDINLTFTLDENGKLAWNLSFGFILFFCLIIIVAFFVKFNEVISSPENLSLLSPFLLIVILNLGVKNQFNTECDNAKAFLENLFEVNE